MKKEKTILYVDDEPLNLMVFNVGFKRSYNVITGENGAEGLRVLEENNDIDFVISDMQMPGMNGVDFLNIVKENRPELPCFILTGYDMNEEIELAIERGVVSAYFSKPFDKELIESYLEA